MFNKLLFFVLSGIELDTVVTVETGADFNISKVIRATHAEVKKQDSNKQKCNI